MTSIADYLNRSLFFLDETLDTVFVFILFQIQSNPEESANEGHTSTQEELLPGENEKDVVVDCVDDEESDDQDGDDEDVRVEDVLLELVNKDSTATKVGA